MAAATIRSRSDFSVIKEINNILLFIVSLNFKAQMEYNNIDFSADKVKQYEAVREAIDSASMKMSFLSMQVRLSGWEILSSQIQVSRLSKSKSVNG